MRRRILAWSACADSLGKYPPPQIGGWEHRGWGILKTRGGGYLPGQRALIPSDRSFPRSS
jgi:hypothetical protein